VEALDDRAIGHDEEVAIVQQDLDPVLLVGTHGARTREEGMDERRSGAQRQAGV
jgi:hypothetical protein